jgi:hypothetical protein
LILCTTATDAHTEQTKGTVVWAKLFQKWAIIIACTQEECSWLLMKMEIHISVVALKL